MSVTTLPIQRGPTGDSTLITHDFWESINPTREIKQRIGQLCVPALGVISSNTLGIATQAAKLNYQASNNFTIQLSSIPLISPGNYNITLRYTNQLTGQTFRYKLWNISSDPTVDVQCAVYTGQPIMSTFSVEIWSTSNQTVCGVLAPLVLNTSVLMPRVSLPDCDTFPIATGQACSSLVANNQTNLIPGGFFEFLTTSSSSLSVGLFYATVGSTAGNPIVPGMLMAISGNTDEPNVNGIWTVTAFDGYESNVAGINFNIAQLPGNFNSFSVGRVSPVFNLPFTFNQCAAQ